MIFKVEADVSSKSENNGKSIFEMLVPVFLRVNLKVLKLKGFKFENNIA